MSPLSLAGVLLAGLFGMTPARVAQIATGRFLTCALLDDGAVKCWGARNAITPRAEGTPQTSAMEVPVVVPRINLGQDASGAYRPAAAIAASWFHACAIMADDRSVKCWGNLNEGTYQTIGNRLNEMGNALPAVRLAPGDRARSLSISTFTSCAVLESNTIKCWGQNQNGQLGQGDTVNRPSYDTNRGDIPPINLGENVAVKAAAAGENHTCALIDQRKKQGIVKCWGLNNGGQLGVGDNVSRGQTPESMGDALPSVDFGEGRHAVDIQAGYYHTCAVIDDGSVTCWGLNQHGELGNGSGVSQGGNGTVPLRPVNLGRGGITAIRLGIGGHTSCAILANQTLKCWGRGGNGELGQATLGNRGRRPEDLGDALRPINLGRGQAVESVSAVDVHVCALLSGGRAKCWGANNYAQLGYGDMVPRGTPHQMGDALPFIDFGAREF